ncbi:MAG TPA: VCBS repeat-containing protein [Polyangiaceae bacterium]|nr:VCBS repeat-containing protein [Polyangiaceae bacterium]
MRTELLGLLLGIGLVACGSSDSEANGESGATPSGDGKASSTKPRSVMPKAACAALDKGGAATIDTPELVLTLFDRWHESWLGSAAVVDLDDDGAKEIIVPRDDLLLIWNDEGEVVQRFEMPGRIWASPVVADLLPDRKGFEVAVASRGQILAFGADGQALPGFPFEWRDEMRSLAAADIDGDGQLELCAVTTSDLQSNGQTDILIAVEADGSIVQGFPPNTTGASGCDDACYVHAGFDQNIALGDLDSDGRADIVAPQDNSYVSVHDGDGRAFDAADIFKGRTKFSGIRFMVDYDDAKQGYAEDEETHNQAHFTNTAPAIADVDGDGKNEIVLLGSVQNSAQTDRERGVGLWIVHPDGTRPADWTTPLLAPDFIDGLWDPGDNIVAETNQVTVVDLDPERSGPEFVFAGFDGKIHVVSAHNEELWSHTFTTERGVLTGGVAATDLSGDGVVELVYATYASENDKGNLVILSAAGDEEWSTPLSGRGAMPVPTIADVDGDGQLEIVVSLKDAVDKERQVLIYTVPGSGENCMPWPTGRGNWARTGTVETQ